MIQGCVTSGWNFIGSLPNHEFKSVPIRVLLVCLESTYEEYKYSFTQYDVRKVSSEPLREQLVAFQVGSLHAVPSTAMSHMFFPIVMTSDTQPREKQWRCRIFIGFSCNATRHDELCAAQDWKPARRVDAHQICHFWFTCVDCVLLTSPISSIRPTTFQYFFYWQQKGGSPHLAQSHSSLTYYLRRLL